MSYTFDIGRAIWEVQTQPVTLYEAHMKRTEVKITPPLLIDCLSSLREIEEKNTKRLKICILELILK